MNKNSFAVIAAISLGLAACSGQSEDTLGENVDTSAGNQTDELNMLADDAAIEAENEALGVQAEELNQATTTTQTTNTDVPPVEDSDVTDPVEGM